MSEEKKEEKEVTKPEVNAEPSAPLASAQPAQGVPVVPLAPTPAPGAKKEEPKKEKPANCAGCKKSIKNRRRYYRNGQFYCTKRCWTTASKKKEEPKEAPQG